MPFADEIERTVAVSLFTRPTEFGGEAFRQTSIMHLIDQGLITAAARNEMEIRARALTGNRPGLSFVSIQIQGRKIFLTFKADEKRFTLEAPDV
jgi:hypothetical protein